jgi:hypothetical protein
MPKRKTIAVAEMTRRVNEMLVHGYSSREERHGMIQVLENMLFATGNYRGYRYLSKREVPAGELPGINLDDLGNPLEDLMDRFRNTDGTRVEYSVERV